MGWLLARQIRPFIRLASLASLLLNVALLAPAMYMLQVFDRVFASGSIETLVMLSLPVLVMLALGYCMDSARARMLAAAGRRIESCLAPEALACEMRRPRRRHACATMTRCATSRSCASCSRVRAWSRCSTRPGCRSIYC